jgi:hypothetical protein
MEGLTIDRAIQALTEARAELGGEAPLLGADGMPFYCVIEGDDAVLLTDFPMEDADDAPLAVLQDGVPIRVYDPREQP